jgi:hypothetical protein
MILARILAARMEPDITLEYGIRTHKMSHPISEKEAKSGMLERCGGGVFMH